MKVKKVFNVGRVRRWWVKIRMDMILRKLVMHHLIGMGLKNFVTHHNIKSIVIVS